ncbi:IS3 family transposase [Colwellia sp. Arc7-635]|uniref:IS3 family transposase n=1 Tax=Colwellia sp. Arc7-635 TaxID=2497879 RepID=UPI000F850899|nr:IS3 family transposase [Colwellia sp. Arc7-635]AZQ83383.1 IS3 family transposase [Colwellia sp. Arc7-635]AZQ84336.1 IS3 family transposase [Colwellia sp. Arc7-635]AZQ84544.1 IS3 family transposase [Colwellia sp. Arc7-635]AZQ84601.1 IS3 family transposase [Colwellia sp. Arc7-635]
MINEFKQRFTVVLMCRALKVSRSGFYRWLSSPDSRWKLKRRLITANVLDVYGTFKARYGAPRITKELVALGINCSKNYVANIMHSEGIRARNGKAFKYSRHSPAMINVARNVLKRQFAVDKPNQKWVTDITYIWVKDKWLYLATVMDLYSRSIIGWSLDLTMTEQLITDALNMAFVRREIAPGLIIHSDRGVQYRAIKYQDLIRSKGGVVSMSRRGNCWDNAVMESFYSRLKVELIYAEQYRSIEEARSGIFEYIEVFYNRLRRHSALGYVSPAEFERIGA